MADRGCCHYYRLISSSLGVLAGLSACLAFAILYNHIVGSVLAFISAVFAAVCLFLHILHHRHVLHEWHSEETLNDIRMLGFITFNIAFACTSFYIFDIFYYKRGIEPLESSPYISAVWAAMTGKWGVMLWLDSRRYANMLGTTGSLLNEQD